jgi:hypothetical protein
MDAPIADWTPDLSDFEGGGGEALNVIPGSRSYRPLKGFAASGTTPLSARCQGAAYFRDTNGNARIHAGDESKLYLLNGAAWADASRLSGGAYATSADDRWDFAQFGALTIACNGTDTPQKIAIDGGSNFAVLGGTPPVGARFVEVMGDFVVFGRLAAAKTKVQWSAINNAEDYVASATTQSDSQVLPDGGEITGMVGYEYGGLVFQDRAIRRMDYEGSPIIFRFKKIATDIGATIAGSVAGYADRAFFVHRSGFFMVAGGSAVIPIGAEKVDQTFWGATSDAVDPLYLTRVSAAVDPVNKVYGIVYCGLGTSHGGVPNRMLLFHWDTGRWSHAQPGSIELIWSATAQSGVTLDGLDSYSASLDGLPFPLDSAVWTGVPQPLFGGFDGNHNLGFFNGGNLAATVETSEVQLFPGRRALLRRVRPMVDGSATPSVAIGYRNRLQDGVSYGGAVAADQWGYAPQRINGRYLRGRITIPAGTDWQHCLGLDAIEAVPGGSR